MKKYFIILLLFTVIIGCKEKTNLNIDVSNIPVKVDIERFEQEFYGGINANTNKKKKLKNIKQKYPYFFPHNIDSIWLKKMIDIDEQELYKATQKVYPNLNEQKKQIASIFKHLKYYYPKFKEPKVITLNSTIDFEQRVVYNTDLLLLSLDVFLGKDNEVYKDYPPYIKESFTKQHLPVAIAEALIKPIVFPIKDASFLSNMIQEGKYKYAQNTLLPNVKTELLFGINKDKLKWAQNNEAMIWQYFIEKDLLYNTTAEVTKRFLANAPFSKFYLDIDNESPGNVGGWIGYQIIKSYTKHNKVTLTELMKTENDVIFKNSKYKPRK